jgi:hypothetical protein
MPRAGVTGCLVFLALASPMVAEPVADFFREPDSRRFETGHGLTVAEGIPLHKWQAKIARMLQQLTSEKEYVYIGTGRHDKVFANDALLYFLAGRKYPSYYHNLLPGLVTTGDVQEEMAQELSRQELRYVVLYTGFDGVKEPNRSRFGSGDDLLDRKIRSDFKLEQTAGEYQLWRRR